MKSSLKTNMIILISLGIIFAFSPIFINKPRFFTRDRKITMNYTDEFDNYNLRISAISGPIYIDNNDPSSNWTAAKAVGNCTGNGTYSDPYVIEDLVIDAGGSGSCIEIRSSNVYFKIENCTLYNAGGIQYGNGGIRLYNVDNGILSQNNCSNNKFGISILESCENILVQGNIISGNTESGIYLVYSYRNCIRENLITNSGDEGMLLIDGFYTKIFNNTITFNAMVGIQLQGISNNNNISGNYISGSSVGIFLSASTKCNTVSNNIFSNNGEDIQNFQKACSPVEIVLGIVIPIAIVAVVITGVLVIKRNKARKSRLPKDEVARYHKLKEQEKQLKDGVELNDKKPSTPREKIIRKAGEANEKEEEYINLPGWYSPSEKVRFEMSNATDQSKIETRKGLKVGGYLFFGIMWVFPMILYLANIMHGNSNARFAAIIVGIVGMILILGSVILLVKTRHVSYGLWCKYCNKFVDRIKKRCSICGNKKLLWKRLPR